MIPNIEVLNLNKLFGEKTVIKNFSTTFHAGANCLMGESGVGKTTLVNLILGLIKPDSGEIKGTKGKIMNCVFQEDLLIEQLSALKNLMLVCNKTQRNDAVDLLHQMGLKGSLHCPVATLSGGMKRRVAIARALINPADIYIFDEPFNGLDDYRKDAVLEIIKKRIEGAVSIFITHDALEVKALRGRKISMTK